MVMQFVPIPAVLPHDGHPAVPLLVLEAGVAAAGGRGHLALLVRQLVQALLNHHPDQSVRHKLEVRSGRLLVPYDGLQLFYLVRAFEDLKLASQHLCIRPLR